MSLNFQFNKESFEKMTADDKAVNDAFIWGCMLVDLREITEKNATEWHWRYCFATKVNGAIFTVADKPYIPTLEEVRKRIGLHTNCSERTRNQFVAKVVRLFDSGLLKR